MAIPLIKEPENLPGLESCHFCSKSTKFWHENTNNPVCPDCAKIHKVAELPDHGKAIRAKKRKARFKPKFKIGDWLVAKPIVSTALGVVKTPPRRAQPLLVKAVYIDEDAQNRYGEAGGGHEYELQPFGQLKGKGAKMRQRFIAMHQYHLEPWVNRKQEVLADLDALKTQLENCG